jgi:ribonuclease BN (tRNA processing enzyme)
MPVSGAQYARIGQHTSCLAVAHGNGLPTLILDAGTGVQFAAQSFGARAFHGSIVLSHLHWDHVQGLPFLSPADRADARVTLLLPEQGPPAAELLARMMSPPFFPIGPDRLRGRWSIGSYDEGTRSVEGFEILAREVPHGGGRTMGLRVSDGRSALAYIPDHGPQALGPGEDGLGPFHEAACTLARGADVLIHDAQYTAAEFPERAGFGHAAAEYAVGLAAHCGVPRVVLFHHDPCRTDDQLDEIAAALARPTGPVGPSVTLATEGTVIEL